VVVSTFVRADINFIRQDFSVVQPAAKHGRLWPADQRYDYLIRLRPVGARELVSQDDRPKDATLGKARREAVLFALRELTGENLGPSAEDWKRHYSTITGERFPKPLDSEAQVLHIKNCLIEGQPTQQAEFLSALRDKAGTSYDTALAQAIPQLKGEVEKTGRTILADRFYCLSLKKLSEKLADPDPSVRRAAVSVCRQRKLKSFVPKLIPLLDDNDSDLAKQVHDALQQLASRDFGPRGGADHSQRLEAMAAWRDWWDQQEKQAAQKRRRS
jgi:hypothetical protein